MIKLDKLSLSIPPELVGWNITDSSFKSEVPYHLFMKYYSNFQSYKLEFSAKILGNNYPDLINVENIRECLSAINRLGFCTLNIDRVLEEAKVIGADFTKDIRLTEIPNVSNMRDLKTIVGLSIHNRNRYTCADYRRGGLIVSNSVNDRRLRRYLTIYNKGVEIDHASNRPFLESLTDPNRLKEYFRDRVRFELRATTQHQIRKWLNITSTSLHDVLGSAGDPLRVVMAKIFHPIHAVGDREIKPTLTNLDKLSTLKLCDWDLTRVEAQVRASTNRSVSEGMKRYEELYIAHRISQTIDLVEVVSNL